MSTISPGIYKITNIKYPTSAIDLFHGKPYGTIFGNTKNSPSQLWKVEAVGDGTGNQFLLKNEYDGGSYVSAYDEEQDAPLTGSPEFKQPTCTWVVENVFKDVYRIRTTNNEYTWLLPGPADYVTIVLRLFDRFTDPMETHWKFQAINQ